MPVSWLLLLLKRRLQFSAASLVAGSLALRHYLSCLASTQRSSPRPHSRRTQSGGTRPGACGPSYFSPRISQCRYGSRAFRRLFGPLAPTSTVCTRGSSWITIHFKASMIAKRSRAAMSFSPLSSAQSAGPHLGLTSRSLCSSPQPRAVVTLGFRIGPVLQKQHHDVAALCSAIQPRLRGAALEVMQQDGDAF